MPLGIINHLPGSSNCLGEFANSKQRHVFGGAFLLSLFVLLFFFLILIFLFFHCWETEKEIDTKWIGGGRKDRRTCRELGEGTFKKSLKHHAVDLKLIIDLLGGSKRIKKHMREECLEEELKKNRILNKQRNCHTETRSKRLQGLFWRVFLFLCMILCFCLLTERSL